MRRLPLQIIIGNRLRWGATGLVIDFYMLLMYSVIFFSGKILGGIVIRKVLNKNQLLMPLSLYLGKMSLLAYKYYSI